MSLINLSRPSNTLTDIDKINSGETWASITTTWASETRTWAAVGSFISNIARQISSMTNIDKPA